MFLNYNWPDAFHNFLLSLEVMGLGMLSIFGVIIVLYITVIILSKVTGKNKSAE